MMNVSSSNDSSTHLSLGNSFMVFMQVYGSLILFIGVPANCVCGIVMGIDKSNHASTRLLMVTLAICDNLVLLTSFLRYWIKFTFDIDLRELNRSGCLLHSLIAAIVTDAAVAILCAMATERFIVVSRPLQSQNIVTLRNTSIVLGLILMFLIIKNSPIIWFRQFKESSPNHCQVNLQWISFVRAYVKVEIFSFGILPYFILFPTNIYIFVILRRQTRLLSRRSLPRTSGPETTIKILTALTLLHVVTTIPATLWNAIVLFTKKKNTIVTLLLIHLMFTNNAINFLAYFISSTSFRSRLLSFISCCCPANLKSNGATTRHTPLPPSNNKYRETIIYENP